MNPHSSFDNGSIRVIYQAHSADGLAGAALFVNAYVTDKCPTEERLPITFVPHSYEDEISLEGITKTTDVYLVSVSITSLETITALCDVASTVTSLDHKESSILFSEKNAAKLPSNFRDCNNSLRSGAFLTCNYLYPDVVPPLAVQLTDDRIRWVFSLNPSTESFHEYLIADIMSLPVEANRLRGFADLIFNDKALDRAIQGGKILVKYRNALIATIVPTAQFGSYVHTDGETYRYAHIQVPYELLSEACNTLLRLHSSVDFVIGSQQQIDGGTKLGLRSREHTPRINVREIAERFDGGGKPSTAGCYIETDCLPMKEIFSDFGMIPVSKTNI